MQLAWWKPITNLYQPPKQHSNFIPNQEHPTTWHDDQIQHNTTLADYADALKQSLSKSNSKQTPTTSKYTQPPPIHTPQLITISYKEAATKQT